MLYNYIIDNFNVSSEAKRIVESIIDWAFYHYEEGGELTYEGMHFLEEVLADNIGLTREEIIQNWGE